MLTDRTSVGAGPRSGAHARRILGAVLVAACLGLTACHAAAASVPALSPGSVISPQVLASALADPPAAMNVGPVPVSGFRAPYSSCTTPTRGALRWLTRARRASLYDMSTYLDGPASVRTVASVYAAFPAAVPDPLAATVSGLHDCHAAGRIVAVATATGRRRAVRFALSAPMNNVCTLVAVSAGDTVVAVVVSHAAATPPAAVDADGLVPGERTIVDLALARAYAR